MPLLNFLGIALPWFSQAFFNQKEQKGLVNRMSELAHLMTGDSSKQAYMSLLHDPEKLLAFQKHALAMHQEYVKYVCKDRISARNRDLIFLQTRGDNKRADIMIYMACIGLLGCIASLWVCRNMLSVEFISIISAVIGVFGSCLKDAYVFEFGSGKLSSMNAMDKGIEKESFVSDMNMKSHAAGGY